MGEGVGKTGDSPRKKLPINLLSARASPVGAPRFFFFITLEPRVE